MPNYLRMVSGIDQAMGRFLNALEDQGLAENTIIVYTADNGFHMGNRVCYIKWSHYEESLRVPMVVYDPRVSQKARGQVRDESVLNLDLPPPFSNGRMWKFRNATRPDFDGLVAGKNDAWREHTTFTNILRSCQRISCL